jgi:quercetin dioxygenase-like cupin family protein
MPVLTAPATFTHKLPNARFRSLASPSRGARETSVWRVSLDPGAPGAQHSVTREEIFVVLSGSVEACFAGNVQTAHAGDAIVVPPDLEFALSCLGEEPAELLCCLPVGGRARFAGGDAFTPPWAE